MSDVKYEAVIGLEVHCQLLTDSKAFSPEAAMFVLEPNTQVDFVSVGYPGTLPVLNRRVVEYAVRFGLATGCSIRSRSTLARKHYFYPDLPKGYQISQYEDPICYDGELVLPEEEQKRIRIKRIHIEEDAGKSIHDRGDRNTLLDFNRCGVPLLELVTEPDIRSPADAAAFVRSIRQIVRYLGICDGNMEEGSLRCDANVSVRPSNSDELRTKTEIKNLNSIRHLEQALEHEIARQINVWSAGEAVQQETRLWNPDSSSTRVMRSKEMAHDYRYFPDPDLPPVVVASDMLEAIRSGMCELPDARRRRFGQRLALSDYDSALLTEEKHVADYFENVVDHMDGHELEISAKAAANFILSTALNDLTNEGADPVAPDRVAALLELRLDGDLSSSAAIEVFGCMKTDPRLPGELAEEMSLLQVSDVSAIMPLVDAVLTEHRPQVEQYLGGKHGVIGFLIGKVMKQSAGAADPTVVRELLIRKLEALRT